LGYAQGKERTYSLLFTSATEVNYIIQASYKERNLSPRPMQPCQFSKICLYWLFFTVILVPVSVQAVTVQTAGPKANSSCTPLAIRLGQTQEITWPPSLNLNNFSRSFCLLSALFLSLKQRLPLPTTVPLEWTTN